MPALSSRFSEKEFSSQKVYFRASFFLDEEEFELVKRAIAVSPAETGGERKFATFVKRVFVKVATDLFKTGTGNGQNKLFNEERGRRKESSSASGKGKKAFKKCVWMQMDREVLDFLVKNFDASALFKTCYLLAAKKLVEHFTEEGLRSFSSKI